MLGHVVATAVEFCMNYLLRSFDSNSSYSKLFGTISYIVHEVVVEPLVDSLSWRALGNIYSLSAQTHEQLDLSDAIYKIREYLPSLGSVICSAFSNFAAIKIVEGYFGTGQNILVEATASFVGSNIGLLAYEMAIE